MQKQYFRWILIILMLFTTLLLFMNLYFENRDYKKVSQEKIILKAENHSVYLKRGEEIISSYDIVLENLPISDRKALQSGIEFNSLAQAKKVVEDYDG